MFSRIILWLFVCVSIVSCTSETSDKTISYESNAYEDLVDLFKRWRAFENPPKFEGAPDYRKSTFNSRWNEFQALREKLNRIDKESWDIEKKVDWYLVWAEMNGYDFNHHILKPWERDPAFYKSLWDYRSDVPAHEGPTHHHTTEIWTYKFPLNSADSQKLIEDLKVIPAINNQAKLNLIGNAKELWIAGIRTIDKQVVALQNIFNKESVKENKELSDAVNNAIESTKEFLSWLKEEAKKKTGASGIGKENYTWYLQNVHLIPMTWEDEVQTLKRELSRAWASLKLEEHKNRHLPKLKDAESAEEYDKMTDKAATALITFLRDQDIVTVKEYYEPALREHLGSFLPKEKRNFFNITSHYDPLPLFSHFYHWFELARLDNEPNKSVIRKEPLLYNIFDSRNEGVATAVEEMFMNAGLYENNPRSKEIVYIMIAQRAARGLGSLYAHSNDMTMVEAGGIHSEYTPRGWMKTEKELLLFEQHLYLRQPGYGTSYITGKYLAENVMAEMARTMEANNEVFTIKKYFDGINSVGNIPTSLNLWQLTGDSSQIDFITKNSSKGYSKN